MGLTRAEHELALAAVGDLAGDKIVEETVFKPVDDRPVDTVERLADLPAIDAVEGSSTGT